MKKVIDDNKIIPILAPKFSREFSDFMEKCYIERTKALKDVSEIPVPVPKWGKGIVEACEEVRKEINRLFRDQIRRIENIKR